MTPLLLALLFLFAPSAFAYDRGPIAQDCLENPPTASEPSRVSLCESFAKVQGEENAQAEGWRVFKQTFNGSSPSVCGLACRTAQLDRELSIGETYARPAPFVRPPFSCSGMSLGFSSYADCY